MIVDIVLGCSFGHEGKGKVAYELCKKREYDICVRFNGSEHAHHTIYTLEGEKWVLHQLPTGVLLPRMYNLICGESVINIDKLSEEIHALKHRGITLSERLFVSKSCKTISTAAKTHAQAITSGMELESETRVEDHMDVFVKMGIQVVDMRYFWNMFSRMSPKCNVLIEGTRGFEFDKNWGEHRDRSNVSCTLGGAIDIGINIKDIRNIYGVASAYDIYMGAEKIYSEGEEFFRILGDINIDVDIETTHKTEKNYNYLNLDGLCHALKVNNCNICIINRTDIIKYIGLYRMFLDDKLHIFEKFEDMEMLIYKIIKQKVSPDIKIVFSYSEYVI